MPLTIIYSISLVSFIIGGLISYSQYNILPVDNILEVIILSTSFFFRPKFDSKFSATVFYIITIYIVIKTIINVGIMGVNYLDYFLANKFVVYFMILLYLSGKCAFSPLFIKNIYTLLLYSFLIKYILWHFLSDSSRPGIFVENNFELLFLILLSIVKIERVGGLTKLEMIILPSVFLLSGSRSGLLCILFMMFCYMFKTIDYKIILKLIFLSLLALTVFKIFESRMVGMELQQIDRYVFFEGFLHSIKGWGILNYIFGNYILAPLDAYTCSRLSFYQVLFSYNGSYECYSVILHSFVLRVIYDFGFLGFILTLLILWRLLSTHLSVRSSIIAFACILLNGFSVSSLNSALCMLGLIFIITSYNEEHEKL
ncbi:hypothetical protein [Buttiauxella izardii]|uniref:O-antigen ligase domain-containing protein n=1 Tax=Buttiauxella izardii TaxID=82991 RepID=A0A3A5K002_9ENTR|nr:hypothetical protein [Buttiauxella izardii]RJT25984.1 hypothetical protein D6029_07095 [Buttiauxella izardii]